MAAIATVPRLAVERVASRVRCASPLRRGAKEGSQRGGTSALSALAAVPVAIQAARELHLHALGNRSGMKLGGAGHGTAKAVPVPRSVKIAAVERYMAKRRRVAAPSIVAAQGAKSLHAAAAPALRSTHGFGGAGMLPRGAAAARSVQPQLGGAALGAPRTVKLVTHAAPRLGGSALKCASSPAQTARPAGLGGASTGVIRAKGAINAQTQMGGAARLGDATTAAVTAMHRLGGAVQRAAQVTFRAPSMTQVMTFGGSRLGFRAPAGASRATALQGGSAPRHAVQPGPAAHTPRLGGSAQKARTA